MGQVYKLEFASGKSYIGITTKTAVERFAGHRDSVVKGSKNPVHCAWRKHGEPVLTVLAVVEYRDLAETEIRAIKAFNTLVPNGYNVLEGGQTSPLLNPEVAAKISRLMAGNTRGKGKKLGDDNPAKRPEVRAKISAAMKVRVFTPEHKARISEALKKRNQLRKDSQ